MTSHIFHHGSEPAEARWQKHVIEALWVIVVFVIVIAEALVYAEGRGWIGSAQNLPGAAPSGLTPWP